MRKNGMGYKTIASTVGLSRDVVRLFCKSRGMAGFGNATALNTKEKMKSGEICKNCCEKIEQPTKGRKMLKTIFENGQNFCSAKSKPVACKDCTWRQRRCGKSCFAQNNLIKFSYKS
jgi:hypothetical protein